jgi:hypothetical protein
MSQQGRARSVRRIVQIVAACAGLVLAGAGAVAPASANSTVANSTVANSTPSGCPPPAAGQVTCAALITPGGKAVSRAAMAAAATLPPGFGPTDLRFAYGLEYSALSGGVGQTVAVVTAYDDPSAETDMGTYRSEYGLPACTNGCFSKLDQNGGTSYPSGTAPAGWTLAAAQALDTISAICPNCHITLVEANSTQITDLGTAENTAAGQAKFVTNTWFTPEATYGTSEPADDTTYFDHPGVAITAPDGNGAGYATYYPAASPDVIAVGGTTLTRTTATARGWAETTWNGTGSGCSPYETAKPSWQTDTGCTSRMLNDVSAVADPSNSPVAFYDSVSGGWVTSGGNNVAATIIAADYALAGTPVAGTNPASYAYAHATTFNDITTGSDGTCSGPAYYCTAGTGYDGPTGLGIPASAIALGATAPAESLPAGPVAYNPANGDQTFYAFGSNGTAFQDSLSPSSGAWSGFANLGGDVAARPAAVFDPASGNLEVYARQSSGTVYEDFWKSASGTWSGWENLSGSATEGNPAAIYNPLSGSLQVFETGTTGTVFEESWTSSAGWSGWQNMGGGLGSGPDVVFDPANNSLALLGSGTNGTVWLDSWTSAAGWSGWQNLGGDLSGTPSAVYNPLDGALEVYGQGPSGFVNEKYQLPGGAWSGWESLSGSATEGSPAVVYDPLSGSLRVFETGTTGTVFEESWSPSGGWSGWQNLGATLSGGPDAVYDLASGSLEVYGIGTSGAIFENTWTPSGGWKGWKNLGGTFGDL